MATARVEWPGGAVGRPCPDLPPTGACNRGSRSRRYWSRRKRSISDASSSAVGRSAGARSRSPRRARRRRAGRRDPPRPSRRSSRTRRRARARSDLDARELAQARRGARASRAATGSPRRSAAPVPTTRRRGCRRRPVRPAARSAGRWDPGSRSAALPPRRRGRWLVAVASTGVGRRCDTTAGIAPSEKARLHAESLGDVDDLAGDRRPAQRRLGPGAQHDVASGAPGR